MALPAHKLNNHLVRAHVDDDTAKQLARLDDSLFMKVSAHVILVVGYVAHRVAHGGAAIRRQRRDLNHAHLAIDGMFTCIDHCPDLDEVLELLRPSVSRLSE